MKHFRLLLTFLILILISVSSLSSIAKFDVHVIYFKPTDAPDIDHEYHDKIMKDIQKYYQSEMTRHGFADKTFPLETDKDNNLIIHTINAKHNGAHYFRNNMFDMFKELIEPELPFKFNNLQNWDSRDNVHLIVVGGVRMDRNLLGTQGMGFTWLAGKWGGNATINMNYIKEFPNHYLGLVAHELGHAFALDPGHNNVAESLNGRVVAWGNTTEEWGDRMRMLKEEAVLLDSRPIFRKITLQEDPPNVIAGEVPANMDTITYSQDLSNVNVLMYTGDVSWMSLDDANLQSQLTKQLLSSKGVQAEIVQTEDAVRDWMLQTTSDGNVDVLILYGVLPTSIHPYPNSQPDGTVAEEWIESTDGNTILNHGDYFGYVDNNGVQTLQDIMDIPHITMWDFGLENNTPMIVTKDGKEITPSLTNFQSDRAFHLDELTGDWFAEKVLASNTGTSQATRADPVIVRDGNRGRIGIVYQTFNEVNPKGKVVAELIANFLLRNNDKISLPPVEPIVGKGTGDLSDTVSILPASVQSPNIGQQLKLSLKIANGENVAGYQATVQFDTTALRYVGSSHGDYLSAGAYVLSPVLTDNTLTLAATSFSGESQGDGTLATLTFEVVAVKASTVRLSDVLLTNGLGRSAIPQTENAQITEPTHSTQRLEDVNKDGIINIVDLTLVASNFGKSGENAADVNADGVVNIVDLALVAAAFGGANSAPGAWHPDLVGVLTRSEIKQWLHQARRLDLRDPAFQHGLLILEQLLASLTPKETALLPNYPNPFNPETWIPYQLAKDAEVTLTIYTTDGHIVRRLALGHQPAGLYENRNRAVYWDGKNGFGEPVASGIYFYTLTASDFTATRRMLILK